MENASKALIIAGAILLAILIISLGIMIYQQAAGALDGNAMDEMAIQQFNQKFTQYTGTKVRGATVRAMAQSVLANNMSADSEDRQVELAGAIVMTENATSVDTSAIKNGSTYTVKESYSNSGGDKGLVNKITITEN